ncbi:hypothetical protein ACW7G0_10915 [Lysobacter sp. A286]
MRLSTLASAIASLLALAGTVAAPAFAQDAFSWVATDVGGSSATISDGGTVSFEGDDNITVEQTGDDDAAVIAITLDRDLDVDSVTAGPAVLDSTGLTIIGGPSVTTTGINAGSHAITNVSDGTASHHAVNLGQLDTVRTDAFGAAQTAANAAAAAQATADAASTAAGAGWNVSDGTSDANIGPDGAVAFTGDDNIDVALSGTDDNGAVAITLDRDLELDSVTADSVTTGNAQLDNTGLTITGGPSVTAAGIDAGGSKITNVAAGDLTATSTDAVTGGQIFDLFIEEGAGGVRYFHAKSAQPDSEAEGDESIAIGPNTVSAGDSSFAAGDGATTTETAEGAIALGQGATAGTVDAVSVDGDGVGSIAIGRDSQAAGNSTLAVGDGASVESEYVTGAMALGTGARVTGQLSQQATAVGSNAHASAANATALGAAAQASGGGSIAVGQAHAAGGSALAAGDGAYAGTTRGIALGSGAGVGTEGNVAGDRTDHIAIGTNSGQNVAGNQSTAIGYGAGQGVVGDDNVALGTQAGGSLTGNNNISIGTGANDGAGARAQAVAIGDRTRAGTNSVALGSGAQAEGSETLALGKDSSAGGNGVAVGAHSTAEGSNIALGRNSAAQISDVSGSGYLTGAAAPGSAVSVGNSNPGENFQRRIVNVADGAQGYDAVNVRQLQGAQQAVAQLVGGNVTAEPNGNFGGYVIELEDSDGATHQYTTVAEAINAVSSGAINVLPGDAVIYNSNGTITVAEGVLGTDAVNVEQLNQAVAENGVKYFSANTIIGANRANEGATGTDAMAIGPEAVAGATSSLAIGHAASVDVGAHNGVAIGQGVNAKAENTTVIGNSGTAAYDQGGVAIGQAAVSRGQNSIVMGTGAEADPQSGGTVDNAIVIGTVAEATAADGIAIGQSALASAERAVAQGYDAHAEAADSQAFGTRAYASGVNSQASGTGALASGSDAIATGTNSRGYATDGIAMGTGAVVGYASPLPGEETRNLNGIAIGSSALANDRNAMAMGVGADATAESATAIGDGAEATAADALAVGTAARATAENASAFGQGAQATHQGSVALGSGAATTAAIGTASSMIDNVTYTYAGAAPVATVSVGDVGQERTITNVAAGRVSATSTDAINGSQLYQTNTAVTALGGNLDEAGRSVAAALGGTSSYNPVTHEVTAGLLVQGNNYSNVQDALIYVGQGWDVSANGEAVGANVAPGSSVDFANTDRNIEISRDGTDLVFELADEIEVDRLTAGDTVVDGTGVTVGDNVHLGDTGLVIDGGPSVTMGGINSGGSVISNVGPGAVGTDAVNVNQLTQLADTPLTFAGDAGTNVERLLGETVNLVGGALDETALTEGNIGVVADGSDTLEIKLNKDIDLGTDGSVAIGDTALDNGGLTVTDAAGNVTNVAADGTTVTDGAGNSTTVGAGTVAVTDADGTTTIGGSQITVGGSSPIMIDGDAGTIGGLTNTTFDPDSYTSGQAATEDQLKQVSDAVTAGWNVTDLDGNAANIGPNGEVQFVGDNNIAVAQTGLDDEGVVEFTLNRDLDVDSLTAGETVVDTDGVRVGDDVTLGDTGLVIDGGPSVTMTGIDAGNLVITNVAPGEVSQTSTDAINGSQLHGMGDSITTIIGGNADLNPDGTLTTSDIGNTGHDNIHDAIDSVNTAANAGWNVTDTDGNTANIGPDGQVTFEGDNNISVAQTGLDQDGVVEITLNEDIDLGVDGSVAIGDTALDNDGLTVDDGAGNVTNVAAGGTTVADGAGNSTTVGAGVASLTNADGTTMIGGSQIVVGGTSPVVIDGNAGTIGGLANQTIDYPGFADGTGRSATEEQLQEVSDVANMGWNVSVDGEGAVADNNVGPAGTVDFSNGDGNVEISRDGTDLTVDLADDITVDSLTTGDTVVDTTGVAVGGDVHLGNTGLVINGGPSVTMSGINAGNLVITNVAPGEVSATSTDAINGSQLHGMGDSITTIIGGNAELNPDGTITTSDIGGTGHDNIDDAIRSANDAANAGWTATDANGNDANIGPNGTVNFTGDGNISVAQTGEDNSGEIEITLNRDLDVDSITAGDTVIDTDGVRVGDNVHLGDTGLVIEGGPSVTEDGIDAGDKVISNVAAGVEDTDAANVGQIREVNESVLDLGDRMDVVEGDVGDLQAGATGPFQVSQDAPVVAPTPTGENSAAGGSGAEAAGANSTALGNQAVASGDNSTAVGQGAQATHDNSVALGQGSATTVGAQSGYDAAYVGNSSSSGEVNVGNRTVSGVAAGVADTDAVNVSQLQSGVSHAVITANSYTDQRFNQVQTDVWDLNTRVDELERDINAGIATAMSLRQAPYVAGATTYYAGFGAYKGEGAMGVSLRRTADNGRWSLEGGFSANSEGTGGYVGLSGVLGGK